MQPGVARFFRIAHVPYLGPVNQFSGVADLTAHLGVEWGGVQDHSSLVLDADYFRDFGA